MGLFEFYFFVATLLCAGLLIGLSMTNADINYVTLVFFFSCFVVLLWPTMVLHWDRHLYLQELFGIAILAIVYFCWYK